MQIQWQNFFFRDFSVVYKFSKMRLTVTPDGTLKKIEVKTLDDKVRSTTFDTKTGMRKSTSTNTNGNYDYLYNQDGSLKEIKVSK